MAGRLQGRVALITAVGDLAGDALVRGLAVEGATVAGNHISLDVAERSIALARDAGAEGMALSAHLLDRDAVAAAMRSVVERFGRVDILVANATWFIPNDPLASGDTEWQR
ncbi:MAG: SDR family NAD(P)-dependent oxidoreductase, partial [Dehalococcoidia bacterium]